ncbi:hypothetical protein [Sciscionella sediminilitoris]|uniref:hypothetical protein n=1 Tax=Sciscionella sediminilitoris TaxID=1445613 RepID=UPI0007C773B9|nr:hypothetical protein [Sciscionella sp. SE31]
MRKLGIFLGLVLAAYFVVRAITELFVLDFGAPSSYANAWGGPSLAGVLTVHCGPGFLAAVLVAVGFGRRRTKLSADTRARVPL